MYFWYCFDLLEDRWRDRSDQFRYAGYGNINVLNLIPGAASNDTVLSQAEHGLENFHGILGPFPENAIYGDLGDQGEIV